MTVPNISFEALCERMWQSRITLEAKQGNERWIPEHVLTYDPGHTTGWAYFKNRYLMDSGQIKTPPKDYATLNRHLQEHSKAYTPELVIVENYMVYRNKVDQHSNQELWVPKLIGVIHFFYQELHNAQIQLQMANEVKSFCTDEKLKAWNFYNKGQPHANDAIRHGCKWFLFHSARAK